MHDLAQHYLEYGYLPFPCSNGANRQPLVPWSEAEASIIPTWFEEHPSSRNVGLVTSGLIVIDIDYKNAQADQKQLKQLEADLKECTPYWVRTPSGGCHFYFRGDAPTSASKYCIGVDIRSKGGMVFAPPSDGYQWQGQPIAFIDDIPDLPDAFNVLVYGNGEQSQEKLHLPDTIHKGQANDILVRLAGYARRCGCGYHEILALITASSEHRCEQVAKPKRLQEIAEWAAALEPDTMAECNVLDLGGQLQDMAIRREPDPFPQHLLPTTGWLGAWVDWCIITADKPQPELALAAGLSVIANCIGRRGRDTSGLKTNLYTVGIAPSGAGKNHARVQADRLLTGIKAVGVYSSPASHAGLISSVSSAGGEALYLIDEFGDRLAAITRPNSSWTAQVPAVLKDIYTARDIFRGDSYADTNRAVTIDDPHLTIYGTSTMEAFCSSLSSNEVYGGLVPRLMVIEATKADPDWQDVDEDDQPDWIVNLPAKLKTTSPFRFSYTDSARQCFRDLHDKVASIISDPDNTCDRAIWVRTVEKAKKLAMIAAAASWTRQSKEVQEHQAQWACELSYYLSSYLVALVGKHIASSKWESHLNCVVNTIRGSGRKGIPASELARRVKHIPSWERDRIVTDLKQTGQITSEKGRYIAR